MRVLGLLLLVTFLIVVGGVVASRFMVTPTQREALAAPPPPSEVTAPLESRVVADQVVTRGEVAASQSQDALRGRVPADSTRVIITRLPVKVGASVPPGKVAVELSGRPVIVLEGSFPAYRDLSEGSTGIDVRQLQTALGKVGLPVATTELGVFGRGTAAAVNALYRKAGYVGQADLPASEVLFSSVVPVTIESLVGRIGSEADEAKLIISTGPLLVRVAADQQLAGLARAGTQVELAAEVLGKTANGRFADSKGSPASELLVIPDKPLSSDWSGQNVRVTVINAATRTKVLAAPMSAVRTAGDGRTQVIVVETDNGQTTRRHVDIRVGVTGGGYAEVQPLVGELPVGIRLLVS